MVMNMLYKKMIRDLGNYKIQFISVFLMAFIGMFIFSGVGGEALALEDTINTYYDETNLADGWIYGSNINNDFVDKVNDLNQTQNTERQLVVDSVGDFSNNPDVELHFLEDNEISKPYLVEGKEFNLSDEDGVWLDKNFADAKNLNIGDNISFDYRGMTFSKEIRGLVYSPEYVYSVSYYKVEPDHNESGFAYMSYKAFGEDNVPYNVLNVKFSGSSNDFVNSLSDKLDGEYNYFIPQDQHNGVKTFQDVINQFKMIENILPIVFLIVAMLMLLTSMKRIISHQRTQIGILKANGFKNRTIMIHYLTYGFLLVLAGSLLGLLLGPIYMYNLSYSSLNYIFVVPYIHYVGGWSFLYVVGIMVICSIIVSYYSIRKIVNEDPSTIIRPKAPAATKSSFVEKLKIWKYFSFNIRWNYRDAKRNKFRALMTIVGILGCTLLLISAFGLYDGMADAENWEFDKIDHFDSKLVIDNNYNISASQIDDIVKEVDGAAMMESNIEIESDSTNKQSGSLTVINDTDLITPTDKDENKMDIGNDEVAISQKMADLLGVGVGDTVKFHLLNSNKWVDVKIDKIYGHPTSQGLIMSQEKLEELDLNYTTTSIITSQHVDKDYDGIKSIVYLEDMKQGLRNINEPIWMVIYELIAFGIVLALIVLYNLEMLNFLEMEHEMGTLKVLGFKTRSLTKILITQCFVFLIIGFLIGIPLGHEIIKMIWSSSGSRYYIRPILSFGNVVLTFIIIIGVLSIIQIYFSRVIRKLDMVDILKILE